MCGFVGMVSLSESKTINNKDLELMSNKIRHRGPDSRGYWINYKHNVGLAHNRLSIVDTSPAGHQPMVSLCKRYVLAFNGEIYNHLNIRKELDYLKPDKVWKGSSDTETLLESISIWGIEKTLKKIRGMFAFVLWDEKTEVFNIARDRLGEKPIYWGILNNIFFVGSELKALESSYDFKSNVNKNSLSLLLKFNYIPSPYSIYDNIYKLGPGKLLKFDLKSKKYSEHSFWDLSKVMDLGKSCQFEKNDFNTEKKFTKIFHQVINEQMQADVPLGAFLSGGIDSSLVVSAMQNQSNTAINSFSVGFENPSYDEAPYARSIAKHLGTKHHEIYINEKDALETVSLLSKTYCEPFADSSQIPTLLLSKFAKSSVTVSLSGDGGDEFFGGYNSYIRVPSAWNKIKYIPLNIRKAFSKLPFNFQLNSSLVKLQQLIHAKDQYEFYEFVLSQWKNSNDIVNNSSTLITPLTDPNLRNEDLSFEEWMMSVDSRQYLPDDIMTKVDRASMAFSLEVRAPFLDPRVIEFGWKLPLYMKMNKNGGKVFLKKLLEKYIPKSLINRPKKGFSVPINDWLRGPLFDWSSKLLDEKKIVSDGFFNPKMLRNVWQEHQNLKSDNSRKLWNVLMFQSWLEERR